MHQSICAASALFGVLIGTAAIGANQSDGAYKYVHGGIWEYNTTTNKYSHISRLEHGVSLSRDGGFVAYQRPLFKTESDARFGVRKRGIGDVIKAGPVGGPHRVIWSSESFRSVEPPKRRSNTPRRRRAELQRTPRIGWRLQWSADGTRILAPGEWNGFWVLDLNGRSWFLSEVPARDPWTRPQPIALPKDICTKGVRWAGASARSVLVAGNDKTLKVLNLSTRKATTLCPCPPGMPRPTQGGLPDNNRDRHLRVSDDCGVVAFESTAGRPAETGLWVWRRGWKAPALVERGYVECLTVSRDGKYVVAAGRFDRPEAKDRLYAIAVHRDGRIQGILIYETAAKKKTFRVNVARWSSLAVHSATERLAIGHWGGPEVTWTPLDRFESHDVKLTACGRYHVERIAWSRDGKRLFIQRRTPSAGDGIHMTTTTLRIRLAP